MNEDFAPFELAKKLKEKGYPQHITDEAYITDNYGEDEYDIGDRLPIPLIPDYMDDVAAPTISQVLKWLREEKKIAINIEYIPYTWQYKIFDMSFEDRFNPYGIAIFSDYEEAAIAGIEYTLDNLI